MEKLSETPQGQLRIARMTQRMDHFVADQLEKADLREDRTSKEEIGKNVDVKTPPNFMPYDEPMVSEVPAQQDQQEEPMPTPIAEPQQIAPEVPTEADNPAPAGDGMDISIAVSATGQNRASAVTPMGWTRGLGGADYAATWEQMDVAPFVLRVCLALECNPFTRDVIKRKLEKHLAISESTYSKLQ